MPLTPKYVSIIEQRRSALTAQLQAALGGASRFVWEVGCGHGHFLTAYAAAHPTVTCVGIDLIGERIERATKKRDRARLTNLHFIQAEARLFLETIPAGVQISTLFVLFPDPWPKLRHNKHRILQSPFLENAASHAATDCPLYFRTDYQPYFETVRAALTQDPYWRLTDDAWPFEFETVFQQRAEAFHSLVARCKNHPISTDFNARLETAKQSAPPR